jgi:hypothetical protein
MSKIWAFQYWLQRGRTRYRLVSTLLGWELLCTWAEMTWLVELS